MSSNSANNNNLQNEQRVYQKQSVSGSPDAQKGGKTSGNGETKIRTAIKRTAESQYRTKKKKKKPQQPPPQPHPTPPNPTPYYTAKLFL